uniref:ATP synthase complex subunit 8 n=1 Tax=Lepilemur dorsalis TaxID=78583 RepID=A0A1W5FQ95_LEPDO|nr:ATP synthase F0 subunit 8 [Lepilemur dorsalis]YP_009368170.1 ATP synthase F0 subunit 8 [Lepilemur mittermeieri]ADP68119.1 ATP synthase F0 subunit 8 [Lepilemur dorsalis]ADP68223.1 ATP synthase F0 subunit 8 [Lepilemur mittermeieri]ADP68236.1 ATP synthase F0 subunit 8 [Lepilemur mittermeieri]ADP68249.1 ATP synthase F0 subunit 8 [Lepilemur dorsalis]UPN62965.1 ATP synthase F0 subunit 8 [Lepilemur dorsalis]
MPQLDTSTWFTMISSMVLTLFIIFQLKISKLNYSLNPTIKLLSKRNRTNPWESKWTKIYSPLLLPQQL